jgi:hypothetical protein
MFPQKRIQSFVPASGKPTRNKIKREIEDWIRTCFNEDGSYNTERQYIAIAGKAGLISKQYKLHYDRIQNKETATQIALYLIWAFIHKTNID